MRKFILAVILLAAAGGTTYYLLNKRDQIRPVNKELISGKWKTDSLIAQNDTTKHGLALLLYAMDSIGGNLVYDFQSDGKVFVASASDSLRGRDTAFFAWGKDREFIWKESIDDPIVDTMAVIKLDKKDFIVQTSDSILIYLKKVR